MQVSESHNEEILHWAIHHGILESSSLKDIPICHGVSHHDQFVLIFDSCAWSMMLTPLFDTFSLARLFLVSKRFHTSTPTNYPPTKQKTVTAKNIDEYPKLTVHSIPP
jgi:hypothetical protein